MDPTTRFYRESGEKMAAKTIWGSPYFEQYNEFHESAFLASFSRKLFAPVCPGHREWEDLMVAGGIAAYPCFDNGRGEREAV